MYKTKIDWCDSSWNPVTGCFHGCEYCYARQIAKRFQGHCYGDIGIDATTYNDEPTLHSLQKPTMRITKNDKWASAPYPFGFEPTFHSYLLNRPSQWKKPRTIFVCSMSDLFGEWVPDEWIHTVFDACYAAPHHRYLFLTKNPKRYESVLNCYFPPNMWFGWSQDGPMGESLNHTTHHSIKSFVSIEPLLRPFEKYSVRGLDWAIVGAETGNRKGKVVPEKAWVDGIAAACAANGVPIFMKESLRELMGKDFRQEYPWRKEGEASE